MLKMIDLTYYANEEISSLAEVQAKHSPSFGYIEHLKDRAQVVVIKHLAHEESATLEGIQYQAFTSNNKLFHIPAKTHAFIKAQKPDVVLVQGLGHPWQVMALRKTIGRHALILVQHHGEMPHGRIKMRLQKWADPYINAYLFTAQGNAKPWLDRGIISNPDKCHEVIEASTYLQRQGKAESRNRLGINSSPIFLSVADLKANKDPLCVLQGFLQYLPSQPEARLYMIYRDDTMKAELEAAISAHPLLAAAVKLIGTVPHAELAYWFSAADYYVSGSHKEACGFALIEAMACGCIPVISNIPPYRKLTADGQYGILWDVGNANSLFKAIRALDNSTISTTSDNITAYALQAHSFKAIADDIWKKIEESIR